MLKEYLKQALNQTLPGLDAHRLMAVPGRYTYPQVPEHAKKAAVLILLYKKLDRTFLALIRRKVQESDRHSGQISFPGGKMEAGDEFPIQTAMREAQEEIGIPSSLDVLGQLTPLYIPVSNFHVSPVVAWCDHDIVFSIQDNEVDELIELEIALLLNPEVKSSKDITLMSSFIIKEVPVYEIHGMVIWGATAMMLSELELILKGSQ